jgi:hypothetical protein
MAFVEKYPRKEGVATPPRVSSAPALGVSSSPEPTAKANDEYRAFAAQAEPQFDLWIRTNEANASPATSIPYSRRVNMTADDFGFLIGMQFDSGPVLSVRLHGRNLDELHMKLLAHEVVYVREFDPRKWPEVPEGEACITGIDVRYRPVPVPKNDDTLPPQKNEPEGTTTH